MPPIGSCTPPPGQTENLLLMEKYEGGNLAVVVRCTWTYDGVSVWPFCDGSVTSLQVANFGQQTWYATLPNKKKGDLWIAIPPGTNTSLSPGQRTQLGVNTFTGVTGAGLTTTQPG